MLILSSLEWSCQHGVKKDHITAGWVGECCSELGTPSTIPKPENKKYFVGIYLFYKQLKIQTIALKISNLLNNF